MAAFVEIDTHGDLVRHKLDTVGNNLTATLRWCETHLEPVWQYGDGSFTCPWEVVVGTKPEHGHPGDVHAITEFPSESTHSHVGGELS